MNQASKRLFSPLISRSLQCCIFSPSRKSSLHSSFYCSPDWIHPQSFHCPRSCQPKAARGAQRDWNGNPTVAHKTALQGVLPQSLPLFSKEPKLLRRNWVILGTKFHLIVVKSHLNAPWIVLKFPISNTLLWRMTELWGINVQFPQVMCVTLEWSQRRLLRQKHTQTWEK